MVPVLKFKNVVIPSVNRHLFYILYKGIFEWQNGKMVLAMSDKASKF